jgi:hypothetical protein
MNRTVFMKTILVMMLCLVYGYTQAATYYVDPSSTAATANGSLATPWKTLAQVNSNMSLFQPGDQILFKRGQKFSGNLTISRSGTAGNPIVFGAYGTGAAPLFYGTGSAITSLFYLYNRSYVTFYGLNISDTTISETDRTIQSNIQRAFYVDGTSNNIVIRKCRLDRVGVGAYFVGPGNTIDSCDIGNMRMVRNTPTSVNNNDDYGANPVVISSANNVITNSYFHDCWAMSFDYGYDGGAIEFYGDGSSNNFIAYNTMVDCNGVVEHGSGSGGTIANNKFAYNKLINNGSLFYINNGGAFTVTVTNLQFFNNVIVENIPSRLNESNMGSMSTSTTAAGVIVFKNNIFWLTNGVDVVRSNQFSAGQLTHENNIYKLGTGSILNFTLGSNEVSTTSSTIFSNSTSADPLNWDFQPRSGSPAVDFGQALGLSRDFIGTPVPAIAPNAGILEPLAANALQAAATVGTIACNGGTTTVVINGVGGTAPYTGTGTFTVSAGTYSYTVTDANGATANTTVIVTQPTAIAATVTTGTILVNGGTTTASVAASGGTGTLTYSLDNGAFQSSSSFSGVAAGAHSITVKDANGCTTVKNFTISQPTGMSATASATSITCFGGSATVTVSATGGVAPYTGTGTFTVNAGTFNYTVSDANGATANTSIVVTQPTAITATVNAGTIAINGGTTTVTVTAAGGTGAYTYKLNSGSYQSSNSFTGVAAGSHSITVKDANGCTLVKNFTITQPAALSATAVAGTIACNGGSTTITVSATGGTAPYSGTGTFTVNAGTFSYSVTDANGATANASVTVTQPAVVNGTVATGTIAINGGTTSATVSAYGGTAPYTYKLNNGAYQTSNVFTGLGAGAYTVTIKDANGCTALKNFSIAQPGVLVATASASTINCFGGSATVTVTASGGTAPYNGTGTFTVSAGTYSYTITDAAGASANASVVVTQPSAITVSVSAGTITVFGGTTSVVVNAVGGTGAYTYSLDNGAFQQGNSFSGVAAGAHSATVKDANGCTSVKNFTITQPANNPVVVTATATSIACNGGSATVTVSATGGTAPYTGTGTFTVTAGTYNYTVTDANGSSGSATVVVTQPAVLNATVTTGSILVYGSTTTATVNAYGGTAPYTYNVDGGSFQTSNALTVGAGAHVITIKDAAGCTTNKNINLTQPAQLVASFTQTAPILCYGGSTTINISATGGVAPYSGTGTFTVNAGNNNYTVTDANGATTSVSVSISQPNPLAVNVVVTPLATGESTTTATIAVSGGTAPYNYSVDGGILQSTNEFGNIAIGDHTAMVVDQNGCSANQGFSVVQNLSQTLKIDLVSKSNVTCRGGSNGAVEVIATGGVAPYMFSINGGRYSTGTLFKNLPAGTYRVAVKDASSAIVSLVVYIFDGRRVCSGNTLNGKITVAAYPNPSVDVFNLTVESENESDVKVEVFTVDGKPVHQDKGAFDKKFTFGQTFRAGTYVVKVTQGDKVGTVQVVKGR